MIIWVTGLSASGKTTLCTALGDRLRGLNCNVVVLDGDQVRAALGNDLGYSEEDRISQIKRIQRLARMIGEQGSVVIVSALYANPDLLSWNRENLSGYLEVYLRASMATLTRRDPKGLYKRALSGEITDVVGVDIPWHEPQNPDLVIDADLEEEPQIAARRVINAFEPLRGPSHGIDRERRGIGPR